MPYKIYKLADDNRNATCGFKIPNGGFYYVMEMTFENHRQLENLSTRPGYSVDFVAGPCGMFDWKGQEIVPESVIIDRQTKTVTDYKVVTKSYGGKQTPKKAKHVDGERAAVLGQLARLGLRGDSCSTQTLKRILSEKAPSPERHGTLAIQ